jgi:hypothetical protein
MASVNMSRTLFEPQLFLISPVSRLGCAFNSSLFTAVLFLAVAEVYVRYPFTSAALRFVVPSSGCFNFYAFLHEAREMNARRANSACPSSCFNSETAGWILTRFGIGVMSLEVTPNPSVLLPVVLSITSEAEVKEDQK